MISIDLLNESLMCEIDATNSNHDGISGDRPEIKTHKSRGFYAQRIA